MATRFLRRLAPVCHRPAVNLVKCRFNNSLSNGSSGESAVDTHKEAPSMPEFVPTPDPKCLAVLEDIRSRGLSALETQEVTRLFAQGKRIIAYGGIDPTADCLHVGHLMLLMTLLRLHAAGHDIIVVIGGATAIIGDPSDQINDREPMNNETIANNVAALTTWVTEFFDRNRKSPASIRVLNNADWYRNYSLLQFYEEFGRHTRISTMLGREFVDQRLRTGSGLSYTEFSYQLFQAVDYYHLHVNYNVNLQIGGNDQWGNILTGTDLIKKKLGPDRGVHGLTMPLVTNATGKKIGKSAGSPVWLVKSKTTPFQLYQHFLTTEDSKVDQYLNLFTFVPVAEVRRMAREHQTSPDGWMRQKRLGREVVDIVHGPNSLSIALEATDILYSKSFKVHDLTEEMLDMLFEELPSKEYPMTALRNVDMARFVRVLKLKKGETISDIIKALHTGKIILNGKHVSEVTSLEDVGLLHGKYTLIRHGKRKFFLVRWKRGSTKEVES